jgi:3-dehydroquinate synthase
MGAAARVGVAAPSGAYEVVIGEGLLAEAGKRLAEAGLGPRVAVIADAAVQALHGEVLGQSLRAEGLDPLVLPVPAGETSKSLAEFARLMSALAQGKLGRDAAVVAFGGGVVGDLAGFAAAAYLRGLPFVQIPTTLLAMVDSSVGGKTGVNLPEGKNLVGAFYQPRFVLADLGLLRTLPPREFAAGMAEVIKYGVIADEFFFRRLEGGHLGVDDGLVEIVRRCVEIKAQVVGEDERETAGRRAILNFGHTIGHAIENAEGYGRFLHGEAVSIGMRAAAWISTRCAGLPFGELGRLERVLAVHHLPLSAPGLDPAAIWQAMGRDKKVLAGKVRWVLVPKLGQTLITADVPPGIVDEAIQRIAEPP